MFFIGKSCLLTIGIFFVITTFWNSLLKIPVTVIHDLFELIQLKMFSNRLKRVHFRKENESYSMSLSYVFSLTKVLQSIFVDSKELKQDIFKQRLSTGSARFAILGRDFQKISTRSSLSE